ncbi:DUF2516 family protein [Nakamurella sp. A5-74]|uniref:DUF2516 family protein n=1 Tax=Nakamurella sp. A5-74 TaxID=3158264 RepID=A0AAU8DSJ6_9ACTN
MTFSLDIMYWVEVVIGLAGLLAGVVAFVDAALRRPDAYPAADKQTKVAWMAITGVCAVVLVFGSYPFAVFAPSSILWIAGIVGTLIYLVDVRPRLREVTGGSSNW